METVKILVVDDEEEICALTKSFLGKRNYNVLTASNEKEALETIKKEHPQLVLLDILLGSTSGLDLLPKIKELDKNIKVVMLTAVEDEETILKAKSQGADDYISKPFTASFLDNLTVEKIASLGSHKKE